MKLNKETFLLYAITDKGVLKGKSFIEAVEEAIKGGITILELREKNVSFSEYVNQAIEVKKVTDKYKIPLIINDNVDVAVACNADGVHLGQEDISVQLAREKLGSDKIIGVTAKTVEQAIRAEQDGADYLGTGAMYQSPTKPAAIGITFDALKSICSSVKIPVVAIGGISKQNVRQLKGAGMDGIAVVSAVFGNDDITAATKEFMEICRETVGSR